MCRSIDVRHCSLALVLRGAEAAPKPSQHGSHVFQVSLLGGADPVSTKQENLRIAVGAKPKAAAQPTLLHTLADVQASTLQEKGVDSSVFIPVLVNSVDLKPGESFRMLKGASAPKRPAEAITPSKVFKRLKTDG